MEWTLVSAAATLHRYCEHVSIYSELSSIVWLKWKKKPSMKYHVCNLLIVYSNGLYM